MRNPLVTFGLLITFSGAVAAAAGPQILAGFALGITATFVSVAIAGWDF